MMSVCVLAPMSTWATDPTRLSLATTTRVGPIQAVRHPVRFTPTLSCSNLSTGIDERSAPLPGNDHITVSQYLHGTADGRIRNAVLLGQLTFTRKLHGDLPVAYPALNVIGNLDVRVFLGHGVNRTRRHKINIDAL
jgi:hypothetical protein